MFVRTWMTARPLSIGPQTLVSEADQLMREHQIRRLPVVEKDRLVGIISRSDLDRGQPSVFDPESDDSDLVDSVPVASLMTMTPLVVSADDSLELAARLMRSRKIGGIPVVEGGRLVGMLTESDLFDALVELLGSGQEGYWLELRLDHKPASFYALLDHCKTFGLAINSLAINPNHSTNQRLVTLKVEGPRLEELIEHLWASGYQLNRITPASTDPPLDRSTA
jgi:acetoin utilization protein AcuB